MGRLAEKYLDNMQWLKIKLKPLLCWNALWLLLFFVGMGIYFIGMPKYIDDYWFMHFYRPWFESQGIIYPENGGNILAEGFPWQETWDSWKHHFDGDNVRLGNLIVTPLLLFPKWIGSSITMVCFVYVVMAGFRIAQVDWRKSGIVALALFMWAFLIPWREKFGSMVFQYNYVVVSALALWLIITIRVSWKSLSTLFGVFLLGLATGWWHEGIGVPVLCGLCALIMLFRDCRNIRVITAVAGLMVGTGILMISPGMHRRASGSIGLHLDFLFTFDFLFTAGAFIVMIILVGIHILKKGFRGQDDTRLLVFGFISGLVSLGIAWATYTRFRGGWWSAVISIICIMYILKEDYPCITRFGTWQSVIATIISLGVLLPHLAVVDYYSLQYRLNLQEAFSTYSPDRPYNSLFGKVLRFKDLSLLAGYKCAYYNGKGMLCLRHFFYDTVTESGSPRLIIPKELRHVTGITGRSVPGGDIREYKGYYFAPEFDAKEIAVPISVDFGKGYVSVSFDVEKFVSEEDGMVYCYLEPRFDWYVSHFKTIKRLKRKDEQNR